MLTIPVTATMKFSISFIGLILIVFLWWATAWSFEKSFEDSYGFMYRYGVYVVMFLASMITAVCVFLAIIGTLIAPLAPSSTTFMEKLAWIPRALVGTALLAVAGTQGGAIPTPTYAWWPQAVIALMIIGGIGHLLGSLEPTIDQSN